MSAVFIRSFGKVPVAVLGRRMKTTTTSLWFMCPRLHEIGGSCQWHASLINKIGTKYFTGSALRNAAVKKVWGDRFTVTDKTCNFNLSGACIFSTNRVFCFSNDSTDSTDVEEEILTPDLKIEKQLMKFMDMWEMSKAIKLLRLAVGSNIIPHQTVILNLLQQLANLGEVDFLVDMHQFLLDEKLVSNTAFYTSLQKAYFNSGRIDEGIDFLRKIYHLTRKYQDVDTYFVLLTVMILKNFPDKENLIESFVNDLAQRVPSDHEARAGLWKCYMLTGEFDKADSQIKTFGNDMTPFMSTMVNDICMQRNKVDIDRQLVLGKLLDFPDLSQKQSSLIYQSYIFLLVENGQYKDSLVALDKARENGIALKKENFQSVINALEGAILGSESCSEEDRSVLASVKSWLEVKNNH